MIFQIGSIFIMQHLFSIVLKKFVTNRVNC